MPGRGSTSELDSANLTRRKILAICATITAMALSIPAWRYFDGWWSGVPIHYSSRRGEPAALTLIDGTRVVLDADTELVVKIGAVARRAALARGEVLFRVVHDSARPFQVQIGSARV